MFLQRSFFGTVLFIAITVIVGCVSQGERWPTEITESIWIPDNAKTTERYHRGTYFVAYTLDVCYPATVIIDDMEKKMYAKGWVRMADDPINPSSDPSKSAVGSWHHTFDELNQPIHTRSDFWNDDKRNVIEYRFFYGNRYGQKKRYDECQLEGSSRYIPEGLLRETLKKLEQIERRNPR